MTLTSAILLAALVCYLTKLSGYLVPSHHLEHPLVARVSSTMTVGLLAALVAANAFVTGRTVVVDARLGSLVVAGIALLLRLPFIVVVVLGALAAALLRLLGLG
ncbi:AzlD domain-containing protein [Arsenicicoccus sp. oral taxon 190]|uniref:AzlD domain-containing protein n=1 Tax=Arsenicicoccus sp. oral taxon 190 TaxID=1658671 RepID=UPI00067A1037|nr:AzlD domain-containing protein [Arsenicicoccus sp. oral taxon 190]AKT50461.1 branched-chain amino acid transporter AzlD [Arsenicicoccus sp. oral taxon 190]